MKKLLALAMVVVIATPVLAQEAIENDAKVSNSEQLVHNEPSTIWPAAFALWQWPAAQDVIGLRLTLPFSTAQESMTGIDVGFWGHSMYFEGIQVNVIRNDAVDSGTGIQIGLYNTIGRGDLFAIQAGLWNEANSFTGLQCGLVNVTGDGEGFQVGIINRAESLHGYQVGVINVIREGEIRFMPIVNFGF